MARAQATQEKVVALMQLAEANKRSKARPAPATAAKQPGASGWRVRSVRPVLVLATRVSMRAATRVAGSLCSRPACTAADAALGHRLWLFALCPRQACPARAFMLGWAYRVLAFKSP